MSEAAPKSPVSLAPTPGATRPRIICHMVSSIDGRLLVDRWSAPAKGVNPAVLRQHYDAVAARLGADGRMCGRVSMEGYAASVSAPDRDGYRSPGRKPFIADRKGRDLAVSLDPGGKLHYGRDDAGGDHLVAIVSEQVSDAYLAELRADGVSDLFSGPDGDDLAGAMQALRGAFGVETLLLEGGGIINAAFLKAGLIDELSILVYPAIDGLSGMPSIFEHRGERGERPAAGQSLRHVATEVLEGGMVWLRYGVERNG